MVGVFPEGLDMAPAPDFDAPFAVALNKSGVPALTTQVSPPTLLASVTSGVAPGTAPG